MLGTSHTSLIKNKKQFHDGHHINSMQSEIDSEESEPNQIPQSQGESSIKSITGDTVFESSVPKCASEETQESEQCLPKSSPRNIFTAVHGQSSNSDVEMFLKPLESDPTNLDPKAAYLKPTSSSRVSFNRKVMMKEVGRYIPTSSPSQRSHKSNGNHISKKKSPSPLGHGISKMNRRDETDSHRRGRSLGSIYISEAQSAKTSPKPNHPPLTLSKKILSPTILSSSGFSSEVEVCDDVDPRGSPDFNMPVSLSCASTVKSYLPPFRPWTKYSITNSQKKRKNISIPIAFLWERIQLFELEKNCAINVKKSKLSISSDSILISEGENVQLLLDKKDILIIQHAPAHASYPYSFIKIMLKDGYEYLIAIQGSAGNLITNLKNLNISAAALPHEVYARTLSLMESINSNVTCMPGPQVTQAEPGEINPSQPVKLQTATLTVPLYDNKVLYLWEQQRETNNLKEITLSNAKLSLKGQVLEIVDDSCLQLSICIKDICEVLHSHHRISHGSSDKVASGIHYSMVKISTESKIDYLASIDGNMIPLLGKLIDQLVSVISMNEADFGMIRDLVQQQIDCDTPSKIAGDALVPKLLTSHASPPKKRMMPYSRLLQRFPLMTQVVTASFLMASGDIISQTFVEEKHKFDWNRTAHLAAYGMIIAGPAIVNWYRFLNKTINLSTPLKTTIARVAADQLCFAPAFIAIFFVFNGVLDGNNVEQIKHRLGEVYSSTLAANYTIWPFIQIVNFRFVPLIYQSLLVNTAALGWNSFIAFKNASVSDTQKQVKQ